MEDSYLDPFGEIEDVFKDPHDLTNFRLFDLPPEIWLQIIEMAVQKPEPIIITKAATLANQAHIVRQPAITRTCRILRERGLPLFYRVNRFEAQHFSNRACPREWLHCLGAANLKAMRQLFFFAMYEADFWTKKFEATVSKDVKVEIMAVGKRHEPWVSRYQLADLVVSFR